MGKKTSNIKSTLGSDLQALTEQQVFRFPSTFTFIFRSFASIDGIGKALDPDYDLAKFAQPFISSLTDADQTELQKVFSRFGSATGLRQEDINTAVMQPKKVAYIEETVRAMEQGSLKIRVRSLENEQALTRLTLSQANTNRLLVGSVLLNLGLSGVGRFPAAVWRRAGADGRLPRRQVGALAHTRAFLRRLPAAVDARALPRHLPPHDAQAQGLAARPGLQSQDARVLR